MSDNNKNTDDLEYEQPSKEVLESYMKEMGTNREKIDSEVAELKSWLASNPILPAVDDEVFIERFHSCCKYNIEKTKKKFNLYFKIRATDPDICLIRDPLDPLVQQSKEGLSFATLPVPTDKGHRVTLLTIFNPDPELYVPDQTLKSSLMMLDSRIADEMCIGQVLVLDCAGITSQHLMKITPMFLKRYERCSLKALPLRYVNVHLLNTSSFMNATINLFKLVIGSKLAARIIVHSDIESLYDYVPKRILPKEFGGTYELSVEEIRDASFKRLEKKREWFLEQRSLLADLKDNPEEFSEIFGSKGTFKTIQID